MQLFFFFSKNLLQEECLNNEDGCGCLVNGVFLFYFKHESQGFDVVIWSCIMGILRCALARKHYIPRLQLLGSPLRPLASQPAT